MYSIIESVSCKTPLIVAIERGHKAAAKALIELGADVDVADERGHTPRSMMRGMRLGITLTPAKKGSIKTAAQIMDKEYEQQLVIIIHIVAAH